LLPAVRRLNSASNLAVVALCSTLVVAGVALAATPLGNPRTETQRIVKAVEAKPDSAKLAKQPLDKARQALDRAHQARAAGDYRHAGMLESLALEWAQTAQDLGRAVAAEQRAEKVEKQAADAATKARHARALLEETVARRGRAQERLDLLEKAGAHPAPPAKKAPTPAKKAQPGGGK
jgi:hypothetical protein